MAFIPSDAVIPESLNMEVLFLVFNFWIRWRIFPIKGNRRDKGGDKMYV